MRLGILRATALAACLAACGPTDAPVNHDSNQPRKIGLRLYRGSLYGRPGIFFFEASDTALTLAYDSALCGLFQAWKGPVLGTHINPDGTYGDQGPSYHLQIEHRLWVVRNSEDTLDAKVRFLGVDEDSSGYIGFRYGLVLPAGDTIFVTEEPSWDNHYGDNALRRDFIFRGIPYGATVSVRLGGIAGGWPEVWEQSAGGLLLGPAGQERLEIGNDDVSATKVRWTGSGAH